MSTKTKVGIAALAALALWWGGHRLRGAGEPTGGAASDPPPPRLLAAAAVKGERTAGRAGRHPPPPALAAVASAPLPADLPSCDRELERLRHERDGEQKMVITPSAASFARLPLSPRNQRLLAPIVDRILGALQPPPEHTVECRISRCRVTLLAPEGSSNEAARAAIEHDEELSKLLTDAGAGMGWAAQAHKVKDALSGKGAVATDLFFAVPARKTAQGHPFDVGDEPPQPSAWSLGSCRERLTALRQQLDVRREELEAMAADENDPRRVSAAGFRRARPNPALTEKFRAIVATLVASGAVPASATGECRESDCQLTFKGPVRPKLEAQPELRTMEDQLRKAIAQNGYHVEGAQVRQGVAPAGAGPGPVEGETSMLMRLVPGPPPARADGDGDDAMQTLKRRLP